MATRLKHQPAGELDRLRGLVAEQHRRMTVVRGELNPSDGADIVVEPLPARCAKPRLTRIALTGLIEAARDRLELMDLTLGAIHEGVWPERRDRIPVLRPSPGLAGYALRSMPELSNLVLALFLRPPDDIAAAIARALSEQQTGEPFLPVFLTNHSDFTPFREQRLAFEYFPFELDERAGPPEPRWAGYLVATLELTMRRWGVRQIVQL